MAVVSSSPFVMADLQAIFAFLSTSEDLLNRLVWTGIVSDNEVHAVTKTRARQMSSWVKESKPRRRIEAVLSINLEQDVYGVIFCAHMAWHLLDCLDNITGTVLKRFIKINITAADRGIRLEQGLLLNFYRDLSQRQAKGRESLLQQFNGTIIRKNQSVNPPSLLIDDQTHMNPWSKTRALALGGTFFQALSELHILARLMDHVADEEMRTDPSSTSSSSSPTHFLQTSQDERAYNYRPCHYFDRICGSGVSGISAVMLGVMRFSVPEAVERMKKILKLAFASYKNHSPPTNGDHTKLRTVLHEQLEISQACAEDACSMPGKLGLRPATMKADSRMCQTMCVTAMVRPGTTPMPYLLRSYEKPSSTAPKDSSSNTIETNQPRPEDLTIVDACLALLLPQIFTQGVMMSFGGTKVEHRDPRRLDINPAWETYKEISELCKGQFEFLFTLDDRNSVPDDKWVSLAHSRYQEVLASLLKESFYPLQLEAPFPTGKDNFDQLMARIEESAETYCETKRSWLEHCAKNLVKARRVRAQTMEWNEFAGLKPLRRHHRSASWEASKMDSKNEIVV